jgi:hypothetical protein
MIGIFGFLRQDLGSGNVIVIVVEGKLAAEQSV